MVATLEKKTDGKKLLDAKGPFGDNVFKNPASLRGWRYWVGARLKFWRRSRVPKKGSRNEAAFVTAAPSNLTRLLHNTASYAG